MICHFKYERSWYKSVVRLMSTVYQIYANSIPVYANASMVFRGCIFDSQSKAIVQLIRRYYCDSFEQYY